MLHTDDQSRTLNQLADTLLAREPDLAALARRDPPTARRQALARAARALAAGDRGTTPPAPRADEQLHQRALAILQADAALTARATTDWRGAYGVALARVVATEEGAALHRASGAATRAHVQDPPAAKPKMQLGRKFVLDRRSVPDAWTPVLFPSHQDR